MAKSKAVFGLGESKGKEKRATQVTAFPCLDCRGKIKLMANFYTQVSHVFSCYNLGKVEGKETCLVSLFTFSFNIFSFLPFSYKPNTTLILLNEIERRGEGKRREK